MFERFTTEARELVERARAEALALGHQRSASSTWRSGARARPGSIRRSCADHGVTAEALRVR